MFQLTFAAFCSSGWDGTMRTYIAKRDVSWPPIPFDAIVRAVNEG